MPSPVTMATAFIARAEGLRQRERDNRARRSGKLVANECARHARRAERQAELLVGLCEADGAKGGRKASAST